MNIVHVFCWDADRRRASVMVTNGPSHWAEVFEFSDLWDQCGHDGGETRHQFEQDIRGQAITVIEDGEARCTSASL